MRNRRYKRPPQVAPAHTASGRVHVQFAAGVKPGPPAFTPIQLPNVPEERSPHPKPGPPSITPEPQQDVLKPAQPHPRPGPPALTPEND